MGTLSGKVALSPVRAEDLGKQRRHFSPTKARIWRSATSHSVDGCEAIAERARSAGQRAITIQADMRDDQAIETLASQVLSEFGRVDILVNNAGILYRGPFHRIEGNRLAR